MNQQQFEEAVKEYSSWPADRQERAKLEGHATLARNLPFGVEGFKHFYWCLWRRELQPYAVEWVEAFASGKWTILECFRGSGKSTDLTNTFMPYCLGKEPWTSVLIVQSNDDVSNKSTELISSIIEYFEGWKAVFPNVVPDKDKGWGAKGYFVKDSKYIEENGYGSWLEKTARDHMKDPSLVGAGIFSADIVGMHPRRLLFDDIHDKNNSAFPRERRKVVETVQANVLPVITKPGNDLPFIGVACTPWDKEDAYHVLYETGLFQKITTPILKFCEDGKDIYDGKTCTLTWGNEDGFPMDSVMKLRKVNSKVEFARMYLCDLEAAKNMLYKWYSFPAEEINLKNPMAGGIDYASIFLSSNAQEGGRSYFAMSYLVQIGNGGAVVQGGIVEQCTQIQAEIYANQAQNTFPGWLHSVIESNGVGGQFAQLIMRNPRLRIVPMTTESIFRGTKEKRQYELLSPLLETGVLRVSDADTEYLRIFRSYLENYPNIDRHAPEWDVADSVLWGVMALPEISVAARSRADAQSQLLIVKQNPFAALRRN